MTYRERELQADTEHEERQALRKGHGFKDSPADTFRGDDVRIHTAYKNRVIAGALESLAIFGSAFFVDIKYTVAAGFAILFGHLNGLDARFLDLLVRTRRNTLLSRDMRDQLDAMKQ